MIVAKNPIRLNSPTDQLWDEQGAFNLRIERFEHPVLGPVLTQSNGREAALRQLVKALLRHSRFRSCEMMSSVATSVHNDVSGHGWSRLEWMTLQSQPNAMANVPQGCGQVRASEECNEIGIAVRAHDERAAPAEPSPQTEGT